MNSLFDALPYLEAHRFSLLLLPALALAILIQNFLLAPLAL